METVQIKELKNWIKNQKTQLNHTIIDEQNKQNRQRLLNELESYLTSKEIIEYNDTEFRIKSNEKLLKFIINNEDFIIEVDDKYFNLQSLDENIIIELVQWLNEKIEERGY